jgi:hypothetical protein
VVLEWEWTILCPGYFFLPSVFIVEFSWCIRVLNYKHCRHFWRIYCVWHLTCALQPSRSWPVPPNRYLSFFLPFRRDSTSRTLTYRPWDTIWWMNRLSRTIFNNVISIAESNKIRTISENNNSSLPSLSIHVRQFMNLTKLYAWKQCCTVILMRVPVLRTTVRQEEKRVLRRSIDKGLW